MAVVSRRNRRARCARWLAQMRRPGRLVDALFASPRLAELPAAARGGGSGWRFGVAVRARWGDGWLAATAGSGGVARSGTAGAVAWRGPRRGGAGGAQRRAVRRLPLAAGASGPGVGAPPRPPATAAPARALHRTPPTPLDRPPSSLRRAPTSGDNATPRGRQWRVGYPHLTTRSPPSAPGRFTGLPSWRNWS